MTYYCLEPEVAGGIGKGTVMDVRVDPPRVSKLHYCFDDWLGGAIITTFPCFIVTVAARRALEAMAATGAKFDHVEISRSELFNDLHPTGLDLPEFVWLKVDGKPARDDFGIAPPHRLVVSQRVLDLFKKLGLSDAIVTPFVDDQRAR